MHKVLVTYPRHEQDAERLRVLEGAGCELVFDRQALDVVEEEPPRGQHPFADLDNVVLTPHLAGGTHGSVVAMSEQAIDEVLRVLRGERPRFPVNPEVFGAGGAAGPLLPDARPR